MHFTWRLTSPDSQLARWLMIVSTATAVFPVWRSPMMSSRCPRPMGVMASMDCPRGSTTRPRKASPTGTDRIRPVCLTSSPSSMPEASPKITHPISRTSRFVATPKIPPGNSSSSLARVDGRPSTRAMPSPDSVTCPISSRTTCGWNDSTCFSSASRISCGSIVSSAISTPSRGQLFQGQVELPADRAVDDLVSHPGHDPPDHSRVHDHFHVHLLPGGPRQALGQASPALLVQGHGAAGLHQHPPPPGGGPVGEVPQVLHRVARPGHGPLCQEHGRLRGPPGQEV